MVNTSVGNTMRATKCTTTTTYARIWLFYEERFCPRDWSTRQFSFLFTVSLTNVLLVYKHFVLKKNHMEMISKSEFLCKITEENKLNYK